MTEVEWELLYRQKKRDKTSSRIHGSFDRGYASETAVGQSIINQNLRYISDELEDLSYRKTRGLGGKYAAIFKDAVEVTDVHGKLFKDYDRAAYIGLMTILDCIFQTKKNKNQVNHIAETIGKRLEEEQILNIFNRENKDFTHVKGHILEHSNKKGKKDELIRAVQKEWQNLGKTWEPWGNRIRVQIGLRVIKSVTRVMDDYIQIKTIKTGTRKSFYLEATSELVEFISEHTSYLLNRMTSTQPCIEKPIAWKRDESGSITGGFHDIDISRTVPFIRTKTKQQRDFTNRHNPAAHIRATNILQATEWRINESVLVFIKSCMELGEFPDVLPSLTKKEVSPRPPEDQAEARVAWGKEASEIIKWNRSNVSKVLLLQNVLTLANILQDIPFWFVYNCDFRGRLYACSSYINPQGTDYVRALLKFSHGKPLGKSGIKWLAVHGANCYGYNSVSYSDRYKWVMDNLEGIQQSSREPHSNAGRALLKEAKDPFRFFAFCREWDELSRMQFSESFISHLPVTLDGSCNGFQHMSALLHDQQGGARVNLTHSKLPQDIYSDVSNELINRLTADTDNPLGKVLLCGGIDRYTVKPVVMPVPYGLTLRGASLAIHEYINANAHRYGLDQNYLKNWDYIRYLAQMILDITDEYVQSAKELKAWLRASSDLLAQHDSVVSWVSPAGFPVYQHYTLFTTDSIKTELFGNKTIFYRDKAHGVLKEKSRVSLTPNLIQSLESSHLVMLINKGDREGISTLTSIHDCAGTYAADTHRFREIINECFCELYIPDVLEGIKRQWEEVTPLPQLPEYGTYDSTEVLTNPYFFG